MATKSIVKLAVSIAFPLAFASEPCTADTCPGAYEEDEEVVALQVRKSYETPAAISTLIEEYRKALLTNNATNMMPFFSPDAFILPNDLPQVQGTAGVLAFYENLFNYLVFESSQMDIFNAHVSGDGAAAITVNAGIICKTDATDRTSWFFTQIDGKLLVSGLMFNYREAFPALTPCGPGAGAWLQKGAPTQQAQQPSVPEDSDAGINAVIQSYKTALNAGDAQGAADCFAEDATVLPRDYAKTTGKASILQFYTGLFGAFKFDLNFTMQTETVTGDVGVAYTTSKGTMCGTADQNREAWSFVKTGADWKINTYQFNKDATPTGEAPAPCV